MHQPKEIAKRPKPAMTHSNPTRERRLQFLLKAAKEQAHLIGWGGAPGIKAEVPAALHGHGYPFSHTSLESLYEILFAKHHSGWMSGADTPSDVDSEYVRVLERRVADLERRSRENETELQKGRTRLAALETRLEAVEEPVRPEAENPHWDWVLANPELVGQHENKWVAVSAPRGIVSVDEDLVAVHEALRAAGLIDRSFILFVPPKDLNDAAPIG